jgi:hypothetical protein
VETIIAATPIFVLNPVSKNSVTKITTESNWENLQTPYKKICDLI